ncbi:MAG: hypothetical protein IPL35_17495 [Sphingobacteriales bacterium]|nr:hypothetical protein [Sphingobacteriales bacterium]
MFFLYLMNTRYYIILVWAALLMCSTLPTIFAQEVLRPLGGNAELQHRHLWQQLKSSTLGWSCNSETSLNAAAAFDFYEVMRPSCSGTDGSISINFAPNNIAAVEITLLNVQSGEVVEQNSINPQIPTHTLSDIAAGVYRLQLSAGGGIFIDEFIFISDINENLGGDLGNNFDIDRDFDVSNERCTVGSIKRTFSAILGTTYSARIYDLHTSNPKER